MILCSLHVQIHLTGYSLLGDQLLIIIIWTILLFEITTFWMDLSLPNYLNLNNQYSYPLESLRRTSCHATPSSPEKATYLLVLTLDFLWSPPSGQFPPNCPSSLLHFLTIPLKFHLSQGSPSPTSSNSNIPIHNWSN